MTRDLHEDPGAFGGLPEAPEYQTARFAVLPVPYDGTSTWQKGADRGPAGILTASANMELYDIETDSEPWRAGIVTMAPQSGFASPEDMVASVRAEAEALIRDGRTVVGLGGEHSISIGLIQAHARRWPDLTVLQFDAHGDSRDQYEGSKCNHACVMARAAECADYVSVGIRSLDVVEKERVAAGRTIFAHEIDDLDRTARQIIERIKGPVYVTIDLDVLDPSEMPSTGTPEPGGLRYRQLTSLLKAVCSEREVVGFDVVELMPRPENLAPDFLAARLTYQLMAFVLRHEKGASR